MTKLTVADRAMIESLLDFDFTLTSIAKKLGRHVSTISSELKRRIVIGRVRSMQIQKEEIVEGNVSY